MLAATDSGYVLVVDTRTKRYIYIFFLCVCLLGDRKSLASGSIRQFLQKISDSSHAGWLRTMFDKSTVHGNDMMVVQ